jgi:hypothetical protein
VSADYDRTGERSTHIGRNGVWIPPYLRAFDAQIVFRAPKVTIQHFSSDDLEPYYGAINESHFGDAEGMYDVTNPSLVPNRMTVKPQGEDAITLVVELNNEDGPPL